MRTAFHPKALLPKSLLSSNPASAAAGREGFPGWQRSAPPNLPASLPREAGEPRSHRQNPVEASAEPDWRGYTCEFLVMRVLLRQHAEIRDELRHLKELAGSDPCIADHPRNSISLLLTSLSAELSAHLVEEEHVFTKLLEMEQAYVGEDPACERPQRIGARVNRIAEEHDHQGLQLDHIRNEAKSLGPAAREFADRLLRLDRVLASHFHLEDDVLLPRAARMEAELFG